MANGMFSGIVQTPEQVQAARRQTMFDQARSAASLTPQQQALMLARESGQNTGGFIAGLFGVEDPELKKARDFQNAAMSIKERLTPEQQANPALVYGEMAKAAVDLGYVSEGLKFAEEAQKFRSISQKVSSEAVTTKGIRVFRRGDGPLLAEEDGQDVPYDPKKHGRFETAQDRISAKGVQILPIPGPGGLGVIGREIYDSTTGNVIRREYIPGAEPPKTSPAAAGSDMSAQAKAELERRRNAK